MGGAYAYGQNPHMMGKNPHGPHTGASQHRAIDDSGKTKDVELVKNELPQDSRTLP